MFDVVAELPMLALILQLRRHADAHRLQVGVVDVGRDDHAAARHLVADQFGGQAFAPGDILHLFGDHALAGVMDLRADRIVHSRGNPWAAHTCDGSAVTASQAVPLKPKV